MGDEAAVEKAGEKGKNSEVVAYDNKGRPTIVRQVDEETGTGRTVVRNEDGTKSVFGESTVQSLSSSNEEKAEKWTTALTTLQLRGLVHEVGQRLLEGSRVYHQKLAELDTMGEKLNYQYFGLEADASERDIDNAYRKLARQMHPDKNGGTEEAKKKFQDMKERYEALKKKISEAAGDAADEKKDEVKEEKEKGLEDEEKEKEEEEEKEKEKEGEDEAGEEKGAEDDAAEDDK